MFKTNFVFKSELIEILENLNLKMNRKNLNSLQKKHLEYLPELRGRDKTQCAYNVNESVQRIVFDKAKRNGLKVTMRQLERAVNEIVEKRP